MNLSEMSVHTASLSVLVALVAAALGSLKLIVDKENKTSENRQAWINGVRETISKLVSNISSLAWVAERSGNLIDRKAQLNRHIESQEKNENIQADLERSSNVLWTSVEENNRITRDAMHHIHYYWSLAQAYFKGNEPFLLNVRPKIQRVFELVSEFNENVETPKVREGVARRLEEIANEIVAVLQPVLKDEWERVKKGELQYRVAKFISYAICGLSFVYVCYEIFSYSSVDKVEPKFVGCSKDVSQIVNVHCNVRETTRPNQQTQKINSSARSECGDSSN